MDQDYQADFQAFQDFLDRTGIAISVEPGAPALEDADAWDVLIGSEAGPLRITVFDEYGDARSGDPFLCLVCLAYEFDGLSDPGSLEAWAAENGLDPEAPAVEALFRRNTEARRIFLERHGAPPDRVTCLDWQLNAGLAQALRRHAGLIG